jgi:hypothetical protein
LHGAVLFCQSLLSLCECIRTAEPTQPEPDAGGAATFPRRLRIRKLGIGLRTRSNAPFAMKKGIILLLSALSFCPVFSQQAAVIQTYLSTYDVQLTWYPDLRDSQGHFEVERSENGREYLLLDCLPASADESPGAFNYTDANARFLIGPVLYYRVNWVNEQGSTTRGLVNEVRIDPHWTVKTNRPAK